jgi:dipeptidyl aminopeptidase/acylaminoacyl peptidase
MSGDALELTAELIVDGAAPLQPVISPDGCWVVYVVAPVGTRGERRLSALWVGAADVSSAPRKLTAGTAHDFGPRWAPDSASVCFLSDRTGSVQLHRIRLDGGQAEALTSWRGDIADAWPLADGLLVAVAAADEPDEGHERRRAERDDAMVWGEQPPRSRLRLLDVSTGQLRVVDGLGDRHVVEVAQRPDGGRAVFDIAVPADGNGGPHRNLTEGMDVCPAGLAHVTGGPPLALFADGLDTAIYQLDPGEQRFRRVSAMKGLANALTVSRSGQVAVLASTSYEPKDVRAGCVGGQLTRVSDTRPELRRIRWGTQERLSYQASDGLGLDGLLILPAGKSRADGPFPLITPVHGHDFAVAIAGSLGGGEFTDILSGSTC